MNVQRTRAYYAQTPSGPELEIVEECDLKLEQLPEPQQTDYELICTELGIDPQRVRFVCYSRRSGGKRFFTVQSVYETTRFETLAGLLASEEDPLERASSSRSGVRAKEVA